ncbi:MAG: recombinase RecT [Methylovulum sp.]|nr:recombinase RecT [Methylovulum sp.]
MNEIALVKSPLEIFVDEVLPADRLADLARSLPSHIKPALFQRNLLNAVMSNYELMDFPAGLVFREVSKAAGLGLMLDPQLGEAYIVVCYNYKTRQKEPQLRVGYRGLMKLARQAGNVSLIYAHEVCEKDRLVCSQGTDKRLIHEPQLFTDRGPIIGYYAAIIFADGAADFEPMSVAQIHKIRDATDIWKAYREGKIKSTPWADGEEEMSKKTVIRRLMKRVQQSAEMAEALRIEDIADYGETRPERLPARRAPPPPPVGAPPAIEHKLTVPTEIPTGQPEPEPTQGRRAPPPPAATSSASPNEERKTVAPTKPIPLVEKFRAAAAGATTTDALYGAWDQIIAPHEHGMDQAMVDECLAISRRREFELDQTAGGEP